MLSVAGIKLELTKSTEAVITNDVPHFLSVVPKSNTDVVPGTNPPLTITFPYPPIPSILLELTTSIDPVPKNNSPHFLDVVPKSNTFVVPGTNPPLIITFPYPPMNLL